jgi:hypothetical protein
LQAELAALEQRAVSLIAARLAPDTEADARRVAIIGELAEHNRSLETVTDRCRKLKAPLPASAKSWWLKPLPVPRWKQVGVLRAGIRVAADRFVFGTTADQFCSGAASAARLRG